MSLHPWRAALGLCAGLLLCGSGAQAAAPPAPQPAEQRWDASRADAPGRARVLHRTALPRSRIDGLRPVELSALAWDPVAQLLWAASDRGLLFAWQVDPAAPTRLQPLRGLRVRRPAPASPETSAPTRVNAEALAWRAPEARAGQVLPGQLWLGGEHEAAAWQIDHPGQAVALQPWPGALRAAKAGAAHGIEALAWHPEFGLLAARQQPLRHRPGAPASARADGTRWHTVHGQGRSWSFPAMGRRSALKAIEPLGTQGLLVLERVEERVQERVQEDRGAADTGSAANGPQHGFRPVLRWLSLQGCGQARACTAPPLPLQPSLPLASHNHEGLACTAAGLCWLVSDADGRAGVDTQLLVLQLMR